MRVELDAAFGGLDGRTDSGAARRGDDPESRSDRSSAERVCADIEA